MNDTVMTADLASVMGLAVTDPENPDRPITKSVKLGNPRFDGDYEPRWAACHTIVTKWCRLYRPVIFTVEAALPIGPSKDNSLHASRFLIGIVAVACTAAQLEGVPNIGQVECDKVRRHFIGTCYGASRDLKDAVMARCRQLGWDFEDHNAADAAAVWDWQTQQLRLRKRVAPALRLAP